MPSPSEAATAAPWLEIRNVTDKSADVFVYSYVDADASAIPAIRSLNVKTINVRINSPGGSVFAGFSLYNALVAHPARKVVYVDGLAASIASVIAMAGDEIVMAENALIMIHEPSGSTSGGADEMRNTAEMLDKLSENIAAAYARRSGQGAEKIADLMATDSWLTASEAKALGFCTSIAPSKSFEAKFDLSAFKNVPAGLASVDAKKKTEMENTNTPADSSAAAAVVAETFTADAVAAKVQAEVRTAVDAAHAAAKTAFDAAATEHVNAMNALRSDFTAKITAKDNEISDLKTKLAAAEAMSADKIGAAPVVHIANDATAKKGPSTPAEVLAHHRSLTGEARAEFFAKHKNEIWSAHEAEMRAGR